MSAAAIAQYVGNVVRYDPQAAQQARDAAAQAQQQRQQQQQLKTVQRSPSPAEQTLEGELLNKQRQQQQPAAELNEDEYLTRHQEERARSTEGYRSLNQRAIAAYQTTAQVTHPADVDRVGFLDVYA